MARETRFNKEAREKLKTGIDILANAVKVTLGPKGRNVIIQKNFASSIITKDGVTVANNIVHPESNFKLKDPVENMGAELLKEVASKTAEVAGDGTTTATVLAQAIVTAGLKYVAAGANPMDLKRGIDKAAQAVVEYLKSISEEVGDDFIKVQQIGTISANGDEAIGKLIAEAMEKVTTDGVVAVESSKGTDTYLREEEGMQFQRGFLSPYFITNEKENTVEYDNPNILIYSGRIKSFPEVVPVLERAFSNDKPLLLIVGDIEAAPLQALVINRAKRQMKIVVVKAPGFGDQQKEVLEDMCVLTGATLIGDERGLKLDNIAAGHFGKCEKVIIDKNTTIIFKGKGDPEKIQARAAGLRTLIEDTDSDFLKGQYKTRLAKLVGGIAIICVGAHSEVEMQEKKDRVDDALHATRAAVEEGIVDGGGFALFEASYYMPPIFYDNEDQNLGVEILRQALRVPLFTIAENAGVNGQVVSEKIKESNFTVGYNARTDTYENLRKAGIIDPTKVTRVAVENAASIAGMILTTECVIYNDEEVKPGVPQLF